MLEPSYPTPEQNRCSSRWESAGRKMFPAKGMVKAIREYVG